jgi:hypothetical protein
MEALSGTTLGPSFFFFFFFFGAGRGDQYLGQGDTGPNLRLLESSQRNIAPHTYSNDDMSRIDCSRLTLVDPLCIFCSINT